MVLASSDEMAERARSLRNLCFLPSRRFVHEDLGYNFRLTNLQAAIGLAQIERMDEIVARKRTMGHRYQERLRGVAGIALQAEEPWARSVFWMFGILLDDGLPFDAAGMAARLRDRGIETRPFFVGMHEQPVLRARGLFRGQTFPVAERLARRGLYLPSGLTLTDAEIDRVCDAVEEALR